MKLNNQLIALTALAAVLPQLATAQQRLDMETPIVHDFATGKTSVFTPDKTQNRPRMVQLSTGRVYKGSFVPVAFNEQRGDRPTTAAEGGISIQDVFGSDDRQQVSSTTSFPNSARCQLKIVFPLGTVYGSANMIDENHVLTAGHCLYMAAYGGYATSITVYPGRNGASYPFGAVSVTGYLTWTGWTGSENYDHDMAVLRLKTSIGNSTGWYGLAAVSDNNEAGATIGGYPGDKSSGTQWYDSDPIKIQTTNRLYYWIDTESGESGAGVYRFIDGDRYVVAAHSGWNTYFGVKYNRGTRLTSSKFDAVVDYID